MRPEKAYPEPAGPGQPVQRVEVELSLPLINTVSFMASLDHDALQSAKAKREKAPLSMTEARELTKEIFDCGTSTYYRRYYHDIKEYTHYVGPATRKRSIYKDRLYEAHDEMRERRINGDLSAGRK